MRSTRQDIKMTNQNWANLGHQTKQLANSSLVPIKSVLWLLSPLSLCKFTNNYKNYIKDKNTVQVKIKKLLLCDVTLGKSIVTPTVGLPWWCSSPSPWFCPPGLPTLNSKLSTDLRIIMIGCWETAWNWGSIMIGIGWQVGVKMEI